MKFCRVIVELMKMNHRRFIISLYRHIPLSGELGAHIGLDAVQRFFRWRFVESHRDTVLVDVQPHLLHVRMRFNQPDHARPRAGARLCWLHAWNALVLHWLIHSETLAAPCFENDHDVCVLACSAVTRAAGSGRESRHTLSSSP